MPQDNPDTPAGGARARRVPTSRMARRSGTPRGGKRKRKLAGHVVAKVISASLATLAVATGLTVVAVYNHWNSNLDHQEISDLLSDRPDKKEVEGPKEPLNILVMGSDTREGQGNSIDGEAGGGVSDTTILIHISANRKFAYGVSIPRDTLVDRPECTTENGETTEAVDQAIWNAAYATGGPACTVQQFEQTSGVRVDNYLVLDFSGFKNMVNALDGVEVCIPEDIDDPEHGITLEAGTREIRDDEALAYVRVRHVGSGTDPERIKRQQAFMGSMINKVLSAGTLARPDRLIGFGNALTDSIQTDFDSVGQMADLASTLQGVGPSNVKFVTTPWEYSTAQPGRVEWLPEVEELWQLVIDDQPLTQEFIDQSISAADEPDGSSSAASGSGSASPSDSASPGDTASPSDGGKRKNDAGLSDEARADAGLCT